MERNATGQFTGTSQLEQAALVRRSLSYGEPRRASELSKLTGLSRYQVIHAISLLRRMSRSECIVHRNGFYSLASDARDVHDYAEHLARGWRTQIETVAGQMDIACSLLRNGEAQEIRVAAKILRNALELVNVMTGHEQTAKHEELALS